MNKNIIEIHYKIVNKKVLTSSYAEVVFFEVQKQIAKRKDDINAKIHNYD